MLKEITIHAEAGKPTATKVFLEGQDVTMQLVSVAVKVSKDSCPIVTLETVPADALDGTFLAECLVLPTKREKRLELFVAAIEEYVETHGFRGILSTTIGQKLTDEFNALCGNADR